MAHQVVNEARTWCPGFSFFRCQIRTYDFKKPGSTAKLHEAAWPPNHPTWPPSSKGCVPIT